MKVLVVVDHAVGISGPHRNVVGSLNALCGRGDVKVVLLTGSIDKTEPYARSENLELHLGFQPHQPSRFASNVVRLLRAARGCETIYVPTNLKSLLYAQLVRRGRRLVAGPNVTHLPIRRTDSPGKIELRWMCDLWIEASEARRNHVVRSAGFNGVGCIRHALDARKFSPENRSCSVWDGFGIPREPLKILYVGKDYALKGVTYLLDAIEALNAAGRSDKIFLVLAGQMSEATLQRVSGIQNARAIGFQRGDALAKIYASADIAVIPSSWENMPFTVLESMASGLAVVASRVGGIPEQIEDGTSGLLVDIRGPGPHHRPDAGQTLAHAIARLVDDPALRAELGLNARVRITEEFSEARLGRELVSAFRGVKCEG